MHKTAPQPRFWADIPELHCISQPAKPQRWKDPRRQSTPSTSAGHAPGPAGSARRPRGLRRGAAFPSSQRHLVAFIVHCGAPWRLSGRLCRGELRFEAGQIYLDSNFPPKASLPCELPRFEDPDKACYFRGKHLVACPQVITFL